MANDKKPANVSAYQRRIDASSRTISDSLPDAYGLSEPGDFAEATYAGSKLGKAKGKERTLVELHGPGLIRGANKDKRRGEYPIADGEVVMLWAPFQVAKKLLQVPEQSVVAITRTAEVMNLTEKGRAPKPGDRTMVLYDVQVA